MANKSINSGKLVFKVMGGQSDYDLPIKSAFTDDYNVVVEKVSSNNVYISTLTKDKSVNITIQIDYSNYCVLEVELFEN
jgi:ribosomal protein L23